MVSQEGREKQRKWLTSFFRNENKTSRKFKFINKTTYLASSEFSTRQDSRANPMKSDMRKPRTAKANASVQMRSVPANSCARNVPQTRSAMFCTMTHYTNATKEHLCSQGKAHTEGLGLGSIAVNNRHKACLKSARFQQYNYKN
jgi:hypothetical protein